MKKTVLLLSISFALFSYSAPRALFSGQPLGNERNPDGVLWFGAPAANWNEAIPIGNGSMGAMIFGGVDVELLQLNEISVWSGAPIKNPDKVEAYKNLPEIRKLLDCGKYAEAEKFAKECFTGNGADEYENASYQILGNLRITQKLGGGAAVSYVRTLDIAKAISSVRFNVRGVVYERRYFASHPDRAVVGKFSASEKGKISVEFSLDRPENASVEICGENALVLSGTTSGGVNAFEAQIAVMKKGGKLIAEKGKIEVSNADEVYFVLCAATNYVLDPAAGYIGENPHQKVSSRIKTSSAKSFGELLKNHVEDYGKYFSRVSASLPQSETSRLPTPDRIKKFGTGDDWSLVGLYFQFGRYLLISSSREDNELPANLQGVWGDGLNMPWNGDYHTNINVQMNYWHANNANLAEMYMPLARLVASLQSSGENTAKAYFNASGWVANSITNAWGYTSPGWMPGWGMFWGGSGWLCSQLWQHYEFTQDKKFLEQYYPVMKGACEFYLSALSLGKDGCYAMIPSASPENRFMYEEGKFASVCAGSTMDNSIIRDVFESTATAARILGRDSDFVKDVETKLAKLRSVKQGRRGQITEWNEDWDRPSDKHRHISHLYAFYPAADMAVLKSADFQNGARQTLYERGDDSMGWGHAWKACIYARLGDGKSALRLLRRQLNYVDSSLDLVGSYSASGSYPNLMDSGPPFQIDGNFGSAAAFVEMLLQSHERYFADVKSPNPNYIVDVLPALPPEWKFGAVKGLRARGGFEVDISWKNSELEFLRIKNVGADFNECKMRYKGKCVTLRLEAGGSVSLTKSVFCGKLRL